MFWTDNDQNVVLSARNMPEVKTAQVSTINVYDILKYNTVVATKAAVAAHRGGVRIMADIKYYDVILKAGCHREEHERYER